MTSRLWQYTTIVLGLGACLLVAMVLGCAAPANAQEPRLLDILKTLYPDLAESIDRSTGGGFSPDQIHASIGRLAADNWGVRLTDRVEVAALALCGKRPVIFGRGRWNQCSQRIAAARQIVVIIAEALFTARANVPVPSPETQRLLDVWVMEQAMRRAMEDTQRLLDKREMEEAMRRAVEDTLRQHNLLR